MRRQLSLAVCITLGSLALYCGQNMTVSMTSDGGAGTVHDAAAQTTGTCCAATTPQVFTKLWEGDLTDAKPSPDIAVAPYHQVIVYVTSSTCIMNAYRVVYFRPDASTPYGVTGQYGEASSIQVNPGGRLQVDGTSMMLKYNTTNTCGVGRLEHIIVAGVI